MMHVVSLSDLPTSLKFLFICSLLMACVVSCIKVEGTFSCLILEIVVAFLMLVKVFEAHVEKALS